MQYILYLKFQKKLLVNEKVIWISAYQCYDTTSTHSPREPSSFFVSFCSALIAFWRKFPKGFAHPWFPLLSKSLQCLTRSHDIVVRRLGIRLMNNSNKINLTTSLSFSSTASLLGKQTEGQEPAKMWSAYQHDDVSEVNVAISTNR